MVVDFVLKSYPGCRVATLTRKGPYRPDMLRAEFRSLTRWATKGRVRTGRWFFLWRGDKRSIAALEIHGKAKSAGRIRIRTLASARVASVTFDPEAVSPRIVYHGLTDWLRWRKKEGAIRRVLSSREVYSGDPWGKPSAWARVEVQFVVRK